MTRRAETSGDRQRRRAEERIAAREPERSEARCAPDEDGETSRLLHELHVHQVELEMQNEELRSARDEIEAGLQRYTELFDFAPVGYAVLDEAGTIVQSNLELARIVGVPRATLRGWSFAGFVDPPQRRHLHVFLAERLREPGPGQGSAFLEITLLRGKGEAIPVRLVASAHAAAKPTLLVAVHDITASRRAEVAREQMVRKDEFLAALAHELRNPLFPIRTSVAVLGRAKPGDPEARHAVGVIERQVAHLAHIVDDLLDVARIARGKIVLSRQRLDLEELVRQVIEDQRPEFQGKSLALDAPREPQPLWVDADRTRIVQVIDNLLVNAAKFTSVGGHVYVGLRRQGGQAVFSVRDDGAGIAPEVRERLFLPFEQAPQTLDRRRGGLGLGLATVKGLVELHGGSVEVESEGPGRGSEFTVRLPVVEAPAPPEAPVAPGPAPARRRVLVIEDNADAADSLRELLSYEGHDARVAYDGATGLALAGEFHPEVVFCDIGLPGMDGYEVARAMRAEPALAGTYLVALSGYARPEDRQRSADAGFDCHLAKPPSDQQLESALSRRPAGFARGRL